MFSYERMWRLLAGGMGALSISSCRLGNGLLQPTDDLAPAAVTTITGRDTAQSLRTVVTLTNRSDRPVHVEYGACSVRVLAFANAERSGTPRWNSDLRRPRSGAAGYACLTYLLATDVPPGAVLSTRELTMAAPLVEMLADSLPDGRYYFSVDVDLANRPPIRGISAGSADVALPRPPLPATRSADLLTYRASRITLGGSPEQVKASVTATLDYAGSVLVRFSPDCPVLLSAYRDRARRDEAPRSGAADWTQPATCEMPEKQIGMYRGDTRTLETTATVQDILGATLPAGRYYFAVAVRAQGNRIMLSAGEADLSR